MSHTFTKQPAETFSITLDFSKRLGTSETISTKTVTAVINGTSTDKTSTVIDSSSISGTVIYIKVKAGSDATTYKITVSITTSSSNVFEDEILMTVTET